MLEPVALHSAQVFGIKHGSLDLQYGLDLGLHLLLAIIIEHN
jgi:hypothetical protein